MITLERSVAAGSGRAVVLSAGLPSDPVLVERALARLGQGAGVRVDAPWPGVLATTTVTADGQRTTVLLAPGSVVLDDPSYDVYDGPGDTVRVSGGPGPISVRFG